MDPITVLTLATTAFTGIKKVVQAGKDAEDSYKQLSKWAGHVSDLNECIKDAEEKKPGMFEKIGFAKNETSEAFDQIIAKKKIEENELNELEDFLDKLAEKNNKEVDPFTPFNS